MRDSNPRGLSPKRFSRPPRYDHFANPPYRHFRQQNLYRAPKGEDNHSIFKSESQHPNNTMQSPSSYMKQKTDPPTIPGFGLFSWFQKFLFYNRFCDYVLLLRIYPVFSDFKAPGIIRIQTRGLFPMLLLRAVVPGQPVAPGQRAAR